MDIQKEERNKNVMHDLKIHGVKNKSTTIILYGAFVHITARYL